MTTQARIAAERRGRRAEAIAAWWLRFKGFRVLARNWRSRRGEIDLIVRRGRLVLFVEIKRRAGEADAGEAITARQRARIAGAAEDFIARRPDVAACDLRFDALLVLPRRRPRHIADAWRIG